MMIKVGPDGKLGLQQIPQQKWKGDDEQLQFSRFAGQEMMLSQKSDNKPEIYELNYLGFMATGFKGIEDAKLKAPGFAKKVLNRMSDMIAD